MEAIIDKPGDLWCAIRPTPQPCPVPPNNFACQVEHLAAGLSDERSLSVVALCADPPAARFFATEVLGVSALPSFVLFPAGSRWVRWAELS
jgi:hypothetical protein